MGQRLPVAHSFDAPRGRKFAGAVASTLAHFGTSTDVSLYDEFFDLRHPFLYRPLVEFCLQLAPELRSRPFEQKWVFREALRGVLPEAIRRRTGKGGMDSRLAWALIHERRRIDELVNNSVLGQIGCVDDHKLSTAIEEVRNGRTSLVGWLFDTLSLETWLRVRSGRWTVRESAPSRAKQLASQQYVS
jgi:asparagine synthetase B (glutamine-hydrolysing)